MPPVQEASPGPQKVIVRDGDRQVHGYAISSRGALVEVVGAVASGRVRKRSFPAVDVFLPSTLLQWAGHPVSDDALRLPSRAGLGTLPRHGEN
jgi:hypothetical protein